MISTKENNTTISNFFSKNSKNYLKKLRDKFGSNYMNLIIEESRSIIHNSSHTGICFTEQQLHDIIQICLFENIPVDYTINYSVYCGEKQIDYIDIIKKDFKKKTVKKQNKKKTQKDCKLNLVVNENKIDIINKSDIINSSIINLNKHDVSLDKLRETILLQYGFSEEEIRL